MSKIFFQIKTFSSTMPTMSGCVQVYTRELPWLCCTGVDRDVISGTGSEGLSGSELCCLELFRSGWEYSGIISIFGYSDDLLGEYSGTVVISDVVSDSELWAVSWLVSGVCIVEFWRCVVCGDGFCEFVKNLDMSCKWLILLVFVFLLVRCFVVLFVVSSRYCCCCCLLFTLVVDVVLK